MFSGETLTKKSPDVRKETETLLRGTDEYLMRNSAYILYYSIDSVTSHSSIQGVQKFIYFRSRALCCGGDRIQRL